MTMGIGKVIIDVDDQDRAKAFWTQRMGFELVTDAEYGQERWIEIRTPDGQAHIILHKRDGPPAGVPASLPTSNVFFRTDDLHQTYHELRDRGVEFPQEPVEHPWGWWSMFADTEGNRFALQPARA